MAIETRKKKGGKVVYYWRDRSRGSVKSFESKDKALEYQGVRKRIKRDIELGLAVSIDDLKRYTVKHIIISYMKNRALTKDELDLPKSVPGMPENVYVTIKNFLERDISNLSMVRFNKRVVEQYRDKRLNELGIHKRPIRPSTVKWELSKIQQAWKTAGKFYPELEALANPWEGLIVKGSTGGRRERSLEEGELERLMEACKGCLPSNQFYVPLAIYIAIETGMRRQEIFNLKWEDIDVKNRRIRITKSKTDYITGKKNVEIVLPFKTLCQLGLAPITDMEDRIFPMTGKAFTQAWKAVVRRAGIEDLHFHDLRRTANTRFILAGLTVEERNIMLRHADKSMNAIYVGRNHLLSVIKDKLDRPYREAPLVATINTNPPS